MNKVPASAQMQEALRTRLTAGFAGHPLRQFVRRAAERLLQVGLEEVVTTVLGRDHYERSTSEASDQIVTFRRAFLGAGTETVGIDGRDA